MIHNRNMVRGEIPRRGFDSTCETNPVTSLIKSLTIANMSKLRTPNSDHVMDADNGPATPRITTPVEIPLARELRDIDTRQSQLSRRALVNLLLRCQKALCPPR